MCTVRWYNTMAECATWPVLVHYIIVLIRVDQSVVGCRALPDAARGGLHAQERAGTPRGEHLHLLGMLPDYAMSHMVC